MKAWLGIGALLAACHVGPQATPVPLEGTPTDLSALTGTWIGSYRSESTGRHGAVTFRLRAGEDTARGEVEMTFSPALALYGQTAPADAEVRLLRVVGPIITAETGYPVSAVYDEDLTAMARASAQAYLDRVILCLHGQGVRATGSAVIGAATAETILDLAHGGQVKMLAIATHGRSGLSRLMLGSVADKLVRGAEVPVLVRPALRHAPAARRATRPRGSGRKISQPA
jgi:nucleotide-binding universal stress UspA family protein